MGLFFNYHLGMVSIRGQYIILLTRHVKTNKFFPLHVRELFLITELEEINEEQWISMKFK